MNTPLRKHRKKGLPYAFVRAAFLPRRLRIVLNVAKRDQRTNAFMEGVRDAVAAGRFQITCDGFAPYKTGIPDTFGSRADFAMLIKFYLAAAEGERKYSPAEVV